MISLAALPFMAALLQGQVLTSPADNPTAADKLVLKHVATECQLHEGALYFIQYDIPREPVIHMSRAVEENRVQQLCVLKNLPPEFMERFGMDSWMPPRP